MDEARVVSQQVLDIAKATPKLAAVANPQSSLGARIMDSAEQCHPTSHQVLQELARAWQESTWGLPSGLWELRDAQEVLAVALAAGQVQDDETARTWLSNLPEELAAFVILSGSMSSENCSAARSPLSMCSSKRLK